MKFEKLVPLLLVSLILVACEKANDNKDAPQLFKEQRAMMDKAKNVGNTLQQQADEQKKNLDQQSQ